MKRCFLFYRYLIFTTMKKIACIILLLLIVISCKSEDDSQPSPPQFYNILSLGDSYTIGQSVCETCRYPEQLKDSLITRFPEQDSFSLQVIAQTGWTTTSLINNINSENPLNNFDLVTLLIGVNPRTVGGTHKKAKNKKEDLGDNIVGELRTVCLQRYLSQKLCRTNTSWVPVSSLLQCCIFQPPIIG